MIDDFRREGRYLGGFEDIAPLIEERPDFFKHRFVYGVTREQIGDSLNGRVRRR